MAQNYPKWPKNDARIHALFPQSFLSEKAVPQTFSLLECMITVDGMGALCMGLIIICLPECGWPETSLKLEEKFHPCKRKLLPCPDDGGGYNAVKTQCRDDPEMEESAGTFVLFFPGLC